MNATTAQHREVLLARIPGTWDRLRADTDWREAMDLRRQARRALRMKMAGWREDHRAFLLKAIRRWKQFRHAVETAQMRAAA